MVQNEISNKAGFILQQKHKSVVIKPTYKKTGRQFHWSQVVILDQYISRTFANMWVEYEYKSLLMLPYNISIEKGILE